MTNIYIIRGVHSGGEFDYLFCAPSSGDQDSNCKSASVGFNEI